MTSVTMLHLLQSAKDRWAYHRNHSVRKRQMRFLKYLNAWKRQSPKQPIKISFASLELFWSRWSKLEHLYQGQMEHAEILIRSWFNLLRQPPLHAETNFRNYGSMPKIDSKSGGQKCSISPFPGTDRASQEPGNTNVTAFCCFSRLIHRVHGTPEIRNSPERFFW